jgi:hypothetical protein
MVHFISNTLLEKADQVCSVGRGAGCLFWVSGLRKSAADCFLVVVLSKWAGGRLFLIEVHHVGLQVLKLSIVAASWAVRATCGTYKDIFFCSWGLSFTKMGSFIEKSTNTPQKIKSIVPFWQWASATIDFSKEFPWCWKCSISTLCHTAAMAHLWLLGTGKVTWAPRELDFNFIQF